MLLQQTQSLSGETEKKSTHHNSGVAHRILQVGFIVPQVDGAGFYRRVQSHLQKVDKITETPHKIMQSNPTKPQTTTTNYNTFEHLL